MFARHDLIWLDAQGWYRCRDGLDATALAALARWQQSDWPAIVRRADIDMPVDEVCLGIALPPDPDSGDKLRIALRVPVADIRCCRAPLAIDAVLATAPERWRAALRLLADEVGRDALTFGFYGSLALQALTGQAYVTATSDIDLLFSPTTPAQLEQGIALLQRHAQALPLDGEILFPSGQAVAWKEWVQASGNGSRVLVKEIDGVHLLTMAALLASFSE
ncbi:malonate decarboxylase holo-[acyl-carrier-protein] synthase [Actimicrobium sp. CCI2.3]|uniref:malonate decarboxylase holo-[acyl-carrier-protein] synthase n=1 Tax=Actimicrobium sp. CCI2.3 TaxID=3048616 RepID=UPI002AB51D93|nr:malonate decarboxylase holo-[acyl-carrier-protein] synthase [Actimicrobium sp. CCI2.3]MDY7574866.1 malonate decarboxylase holo-[acyl-carrier-protein] synthase [Actimicrobium sp. CCI2.3]MEB0020173.1 malonate decarboxylase holo-[acyl-carrier-protein] synthase [Actimicrobium sp. CCI2.3]